MSQTAMDAAAFTEMKELMGDSFKDVISLCLQNLPAQLNEIETALGNGDPESLFNTSHKMKSTCGSIGAFGLAEKVEVIEIISRNGSVDVSEQALNDFRSAIDQVISILNAELNK